MPLCPKCGSILTSKQCVFCGKRTDINFIPPLKAILKKGGFGFPKFPKITKFPYSYKKSIPKISSLKVPKSRLPPYKESNLQKGFSPSVYKSISQPLYEKPSHEDLTILQSDQLESVEVVPEPQPREEITELTTLDCKIIILIGLVISLVFFFFTKKIQDVEIFIGFISGFSLAFIFFKIKGPFSLKIAMKLGLIGAIPGILLLFFQELSVGIITGILSLPKLLRFLLSYVLGSILFNKHREINKMIKKLIKIIKL